MRHPCSTCFGVVGWVASLDDVEGVSVQVDRVVPAVALTHVREDQVVDFVVLNRENLCQLIQ